MAFFMILTKWSRYMTWCMIVWSASLQTPCLVSLQLCIWVNESFQHNLWVLLTFKEDSFNLKYCSLFISHGVHTYHHHVIVIYLYQYLTGLSLSLSSFCLMVHIWLTKGDVSVSEHWVMWFCGEINVLLETANITCRCYSVVVDISALFSEVPTLNVYISTRDFPQSTHISPTGFGPNWAIWVCNRDENWCNSYFSTQTVYSFMVNFAIVNAHGKLWSK
jgi:hypothetical protein